MSRDNDAVAHLSKLVSLDPLSPWTHGVSAFMHYVIGRHEEGLRESRAALDLRAESMLGLWSEGLALRGLARFRESIATFERAVKLIPSAQFLRFELATSYASAGAREQAEGILQTIEQSAATTYVSPGWRCPDCPRPRQRRRYHARAGISRRNTDAGIPRSRLVGSPAGPSAICRPGEPHRPSAVGRRTSIAVVGVVRTSR